MPTNRENPPNQGVSPVVDSGEVDARVSTRPPLEFAKIHPLQRLPMEETLEKRMWDTPSLVQQLVDSPTHPMPHGNCIVCIRWVR